GPASPPPPHAAAEFPGLRDNRVRPPRPPAPPAPAPEPGRPGSRSTGPRSRRRAPVPCPGTGPAGPTGRWAGGRRGSALFPTTASALLHGRVRRRDRVVVGDLAHLGRATGRAEVLEELDVHPVEVLELVRKVVLVEDRLDRADRLTSAAVHAL